MNLGVTDSMRKLPEKVDSSDGELSGTDVGPVLRELLTRTDGFFGGPDHLTLCDELVRAQVPERGCGRR